MSTENTRMAYHHQHAVQSTISSPDEVEHLAAELADDYIGYFNIDLTHEQREYEDSIEECLQHLEEITLYLDKYKQKGEIIDTFVQKVLVEEGSLHKFYEHVDEMEKFVIATNKLLDELEQSLKNSEDQFNSSKFKRLFGFISKGISRLVI